MKKLIAFFSFLGLIIFGVSLGSCASSTNAVKSESFSTVSTNLENDSIANYGVETTDLVFTISTVSTTSTSLSVSVGVKLSDNITDGKNNFYVGYYEESDKQYTAKLLYDIKYSNGTTYTKSTNIIKKNSNGNYDGIGDYLGADSLSTFCDIPYPYGSTIDVESIKLVNVFEADIVKQDGTVVSRLPKYDSPYFVSAQKSSIYKEYKFDDFLGLSYVGKSSFAGFTSIKVDAKSNGAAMYMKLRPSAYAKYKKQLDNNEYYVRTRLSFSGDSQYVFTMKDGSEIRRNTISSNIELSNEDNVCYFLIENLDLNNVKNVEFYNVYINLGIYNRAAFKEVSGSNIAVAIRFNLIDFGFVDILDGAGKVVIPASSNVYNVDINLILIFTMIGFVVIYWSIVVVSYFYLKNKYKNDEFKAVRTNQYYKTATMGFVFLGSLILMILTIVFRKAFLNNSFAVYNPIDVYIIIFSVISIILFGYFVRYFWLNIKAAKEKRDVDRLKLNKNIADDGTLITKNS